MGDTTQLSNITFTMYVLINLTRLREAGQLALMPRNLQFQSFEPMHRLEPKYGYDVEQKRPSERRMRLDIGIDKGFSLAGWSGDHPRLSGKNLA